jgi:hypothetical protein
MSWKATAYVKPLKTAPDGALFTRSEKLLLLILADYHNEEKGCAWPSAATLAKDTLMTTRHVRTLLGRVRQKGVLCVSKRLSGEGDFDTNVYHFHEIDCEHSHEGGSELSSPPVVNSVHHGSEVMSSPRSELIGSPRVVNSGGHAYKDEPLVGTATEPPPTLPPEEAPLTEPQPRLPGVGVCSRFTLRDCQQWARHRAAQPGSRLSDPAAVAYARYRDGTADELIEQFLSRTPEQIAKARATPESKNLFYGEALNRIRSMLSHDSRGAQAIIDEMPLDEEVRERLIAKFVPASEGAI